MSEHVEPRFTVLSDRAAALMRRAGHRTLAGGRFRVPEVASELSGLTGPELDRLRATRRSVRSYASDPVPRDGVLRICRAGTGSAIVPAGSAIVPGAAGPGAARWLVLARAVGDTDPAVYEYRDGDLVTVAELPSDESMAGLTAAQFASAPCVVQPVWDMGSALAGDGADGYLNQLLQTGFGLYAAHLVATRVGLGSCLVRGLHPATLAAAGGWGGLDSRPYLALALGRIRPQGSAR